MGEAAKKNSLSSFFNPNISKKIWVLDWYKFLPPEISKKKIVGDKNTFSASAKWEVYNLKVSRLLVRVQMSANLAKYCEV